MYKIGIVGFGVVGKSLLAFLSDRATDLMAGCPNYSPDDHQDLAINKALEFGVWDERVLPETDQEFIRTHGARVFSAQDIDLDAFVNSHDYIVTSPGVNLTKYKKLEHKFLCELDFFSDFFDKPVIAITGSLGKTTTTKLLGKLTSMARYTKHNQAETLLDFDFSAIQSVKSVVGGNIGIGMLDLIEQKNNYDLGVLELSSFQLEMNKKFAPDIAVWTNLYPNHLDRHGDVQGYSDAKFNVMRYQTSGQVALFSLDMLIGEYQDYVQKELLKLKSKIYVVSTKPVDQATLARITIKKFTLFYAQNNSLYVSSVCDGVAGLAQKLCDLDQLPPVTFLENWLQVLVVLYAMGADLENLVSVFSQDQELLDDHHHRVEHFAKINGVDFYDDSKSTVIQATQAAVGKLAAENRPLVVILGGLSKGVDRSPLLDYLRTVPNLKKIYCFGKDCAAFTTCSYFPTLEETVHDIASIMQPGDQVLFSPSGASFDLFQNYKHRGQIFKDLVRGLEKA
jgi:UDP-N-acetylmuramoylalanine--D-glutamate ligase